MCSFASRGRLHYIGFLLLVLLIGSQSSRAQPAGQWTHVILLPIIPIAAALLPDGRVLGWSSNTLTTFENDIGATPSQTFTSLATPQSPYWSRPELVTNPPYDMFCPGTAYLPNGQLLVNGGSSSPETSIYDPPSSTWSSDAPMNVPRGYNASVLLSNGSVFTLGGSFTGGSDDKIGELWAPGQGWRRLVGISAQPITGPDPEDVGYGFAFRGDKHAWLFAVRDGRVFHAGPSAEMHWITTDGDGTIVSAGNRADDPYSMNGNAVMYDIGLIFKAGGAPAYTSGRWGDAAATTRTYVIDINAAIADPQNPVVVRPTAPMTFPRTYANAVVLPTGQILVVGGQTPGVTFSDDNPVLIPELWDPATESFTQLAPMQTPRVYHSVALLLSDGRAFAGGGGQCGDCAVNHPNARSFRLPISSRRMALWRRAQRSLTPLQRERSDKPSQ